MRNETRTNENVYVSCQRTCVFVRSQVVRTEIGNELYHFGLSSRIPTTWRRTLRRALTGRLGGWSAVHIDNGCKIRGAIYNIYVKCDVVYTNTRITYKIYVKYECIISMSVTISTWKPCPYTVIQIRSFYTGITFSCELWTWLTSTPVNYSLCVHRNMAFIAVIPQTKRTTLQKELYRKTVWVFCH